ncbi:MAG: trypco2 family protein [Nitrosopumilaceae archaeon]
MMLTTNSSELTEFIKAVSKGIEEAQENGSFELLTPIDFEVSVIVKKEGKGGINIAVVGAGAKYEKESISKIKFSVGNPHSWEQLAKMTEVFQLSSKMSKENIETALKVLQSQTK